MHQIRWPGIIFLSGWYVTNCLYHIWFLILFIPEVVVPVHLGTTLSLYHLRNGSRKTSRSSPYWFMFGSFYTTSWFNCILFTRLHQCFIVFLFLYMYFNLQTCCFKQNLDIWEQIIKNFFALQWIEWSLEFLCFICHYLGLEFGSLVLGF